MTTNNQGFNQLQRDQKSFMTDNFSIQDKNVGTVNFHDTLRFNNDGTIGGKPHSTFSVGNYNPYQPLKEHKTMRINY